ncbi:MAG: phosphoglycerate dehydrogenase [Clostridia bacterium]|nr:phosphoglycerate dehydrogenase [Clostridia bacterium]
MYEVLTLNKIAKCGLDMLDEDIFTVTDASDTPDAVILRSFSMHDMEIPKTLKAVARAGAGVNNIPIDKMSELGIPVFNTPGANANAVAELTLAGLLLASRKVTDAVDWAKTLKGEGANVEKLVEKGKSAFAGPEIKGKTLGVVGLGAIGVMVANLASSMGMKVIGYDPYISIDAAWMLSGSVKKSSDLKALAAKCDYITMHLPLMDSTKGMINEELMECMEDGVRILNFARGALVDNAAMKKALESGKVACYVTDFPSEETLDMPNTVNIPHLGASTPESEDNCAVMAAKELSEFMCCGNIKNSVNYPNCEMPMDGKFRVTVAHKNIPNMLATFSRLMSDANINIINMMNKSKGENAYTIIDVDAIPDSVEAQIEAVEGVQRVRIIKNI